MWKAELGMESLQLFSYEMMCSLSSDTSLSKPRRVLYYMVSILFSVSFFACFGGVLVLRRTIP